MKIELHAYGAVKKEGVTYLLQSDSLVEGFIKVYSLLKADPSTYFTKEYKQMGFSAEECLLDKIDETINEMNIGKLSDIVSHGYFGPSLSSAKYLNANATLMSIYTTLQGNVNCLTPLTSDEANKYSRAISYALGDILFALSRTIYDPIDARQFLELDETCTFSHDLQIFFSSKHVTPEEYAAHICELRTKFISVIPLFEDDPEKWEMITANLPDSVVDTLVDYGIYITDFDLRAYKLGALQIDENYIEDLCNRAENSDYIGNAAPHDWQRFTQLLSDSQVTTLVPYTDSLTEEDIELPVKEGSVSDEYFDFLIKKYKGDTGDTTHFFK